MKIENVLISLFNKEGIEELIKVLKEHNINIYATTSTKKYIEEKGFDNIKSTEEITGISSILGGRVKTLNTDLFAGILARKGVDSTTDIPVLFDMVIVDLYPFEETYKNTKDENTLIEKIDIGGITLIRAAAKNYQYVVPVVYKDDYKTIINQLNENNGEIEEDISRKLAEKAFLRVLEYDSEIHKFFSYMNYSNNAKIIVIKKEDDLRYGENPHQKASVYKINNMKSIIDFEVLHGKAMSYNNYMDIDAALNIAYSFEEPAAAIIKHTNPCGVGSADTIEEAYELAHLSDPKSAFGGIVALNRKCNLETALLIHSTFIEVVASPDYDEDALQLLMKKKNIRLLKGKYSMEFEDEYRYIQGGFLVQKKDNRFDREEDFEIVSYRPPTERERKAMMFAWRVARNVKSNGIVIATENRTLGIGAGQMSRIDAVDIAIKKSGGMAGYTGGSALASDGFFPFRDSIDAAYKAGIYAIIEPGGSRRDSEVIDACNEYDMALIFTHIRHFKH